MNHTIIKPVFDYSALEPYIDAQTMELHVEKHHQGYADKLNAALADHPDLQSKTLEELVSIDLTLVKNFAGGVANHDFFWSILSPEFDQPVPDSLVQLISSNFESVDNFKTTFTDTATKLFGSGWVWVVADSSVQTHNYASLQIVSTPNQDSPLSSNLTPLLGIDLWEHAYYLKYQNRRPEYIQNFWHLVNWKEISKKVE